MIRESTNFRLEVSELIRESTNPKAKSGGNGVLSLGLPLTFVLSRINRKGRIRAFADQCETGVDRAAG